jgi:hypothetical protein
LDVANEVKHRQLVGQEDVIILDRKPKGAMKLQLSDAMTVTYLAAAKTNSAGSIQIIHGALGNQVCLNSHVTPNVTMDSPKYSSTDGIDMFDANLSFVPVSGNDEFTLTIK